MRRCRSQEEVELNLASMLDMAFQLLAFFILTFQAAPDDWEVRLNMPPAGPISPDGPPVATGPTVRGVGTLKVRLDSTSGPLESMTLGDERVHSLRELQGKLAQLLGSRDCPFEQVVLQASGDLDYGALLNVFGLCREQVRANGDKVKLCLVEMGPGR